MNISSRTPEGEPNRCPICHNALRLEPSRPPGDAPCPFCGALLWFSADQVEAQRIEAFFIASVSVEPPCDGARTSDNLPPLKVSDRVRVIDGMFAEAEGEVLEVDQARGRVTIEVNVFGKNVPVETERSRLEWVR